MKISLMQSPAPTLLNSFRPMPFQQDLIEGTESATLRSRTHSTFAVRSRTQSNDHIASGMVSKEGSPEVCTPPQLQARLESLEAPVDPNSMESKKDTMNLVIFAAECIETSISSNLATSADFLRQDAFDERHFAPGLIAVEPSFQCVHSFLAHAVDRASFTTGVLVAIVVIWRRVPKYITVTCYNWRILLLLTILIAQKIIDDKPLGSNQFKEMWRSSTKQMPSFVLPIPKICKMEVDMLGTMTWDVHVSTIDWSDTHLELMEALAERRSGVQT